MPSPDMPIPQSWSDSAHTCPLATDTPLEPQACGSISNPIVITSCCLYLEESSLPLPYRIHMVTSCNVRWGSRA